MGLAETYAQKWTTKGAAGNGARSLNQVVPCARVWPKVGQGLKVL